MSETSNSRAVAPAARFKSALAQQMPSLKAVLPAHIAPEKFERVVLLAVQKDPKLLETDQRTLFLECQKAAADGLMPDGREGAFIRRWNSSLGKEAATWQPMVAGLMKLARNSGEIASITSQVVYEGEPFRVVLGDEERIEHERRLDLPDGAKMIGAYAIARLKDGSDPIREFMTTAQIEKVRNTNKQWAKGPWAAWPEEMARKTLVRRLVKRLPLSTDKDHDSRFQSAAERVDDLHQQERQEPMVTIDGEIMDPFEAAAAGVEVQSIAAARQDAPAPEVPAKTIDAAPAEVDDQQDGLLDTPMDIAADLIGRMNGIKTTVDLDRFLKHPKTGEMVAKFDNMPQVSGEWLRAIDARRKALSSSIAA